jgi:hypothetical protein
MKNSLQLKSFHTCEDVNTHVIGVVKGVIAEISEMVEEEESA